MSCALFFVQELRAQNNYKSEEDLKKNAQRLFIDEEYSRALPLFSQLLSLYPKESDYFYKYGVCLLYGDRRDVKKPIKYLENALHSSHINPDLYYHLGYAYHMNYRFSEAINYYNLYKQNSTDTKKFNADQQIQMCRNGLLLLTSIKDLYVFEKKEVNIKDYFRSYNDQGFGGKLLMKPAEFKTKTDKKKKDNSVIFLCDTNKIIYFSSYGDNQDNRDIYKSVKQPDGKWSKPERLNSFVNTEFDEDYPFLLPSGKTMYFCSKGHNSMGGYDIFRTDIDTTTGDWGEPVNLDFAINTPFDDILFVTDTNQSYARFSSNRTNADGLITVYKVRVDQRPEEKFDIKIKSLASKIEQDSAYQRSLSMLNEKSALNVNANVSMFKDIDSKLIARNEFKKQDEEENNIKSILPKEIDESKNKQNIVLPNKPEKKSVVPVKNNEKPKPSKSTIVKKEVVNIKPQQKVEIQKDDISNNQILDDFIKQSNQIKAEAEQILDKKYKADNLYEKKKQDALAKNQQADDLLKETEKTNNLKDKQFNIVLAEKIKSEAKKLSEESEDALNLSKDFVEQYQQKQAELKENEDYISKIKNAIASGVQNPNALEQSDTVKKEVVSKNQPLTVAKNNQGPSSKNQIKKNEVSEKIRVSAESAEYESQKLVKGSSLALHSSNSKLIASKAKLDSAEKLNIKLKTFKDAQVKENQIKKINQLKTDSKQLADDAGRDYNLSIQLSQAASDKQNEARTKRKQANDVEKLAAHPENSDSIHKIEIASQENLNSSNTKDFDDEINRLENETKNKKATASPINTQQLKEEILKLQSTEVETTTPKPATTESKNNIVEGNKQPVNEPETQEPKKEIKPVVQEQKPVVDQALINQQITSENSNIVESNKEKINKIKSDKSFNEKKYSESQIAETNNLEKETIENIEKADQLRKEASKINDVQQKNKLLDSALAQENIIIEKQNRILFIIGNEEKTNLSDTSKTPKVIVGKANDIKPTDINLKDVLSKKDTSKIKISEKDFTLLFDNAMNYINNKQYKDASVILKQLLAIDSNNANLNYQFGFCNIKMFNDKSIAMPYLKKASENVSLKYNNQATQKVAPVYTYYYLGLTYQYLSDCDNALKEYLKFEEVVYPSNSADFNDALDDIRFLKSLCLKKQMANINSHPDNIQKQERAKLSAVEKVNLNINQKNIKQYYNDAVTLMNDNDFEKALPILLNLLKKDLTNANLNYLTGACYMAMSHDNKIALSYFRKAEPKVNAQYKSNANETNSPPKTLYYLAQIYQLNDDCEKAVYYYNQYEKFLAANDEDELEDVNNKIGLCNQLLLTTVVNKNKQPEINPIKNNETAAVPIDTAKKVIVSKPENSAVKETPKVANKDSLKIVANIQTVQTKKDIEKNTANQTKKTPVVTVNPVVRSIEPGKIIEPQIDIQKKDTSKNISQKTVSLNKNKVEKQATVQTNVIDTTNKKLIVKIETKEKIENKPVVIVKKTESDKNIKIEKQKQIESAKTIAVNQQIVQISDNNIVIAEIDNPKTFVSNYSNENPIPMDPALSNGLIYKVQIGAFKKVITQNLFIGLKPIVGETSTLPGFIRYMAGNFTDLNAADKARIAIKKIGYNDCFVVAYYNGKRISLNQANEIAKGKDIETTLSKVAVKKAHEEVSDKNLNNKIVKEISSVKDIFYTVQVGYFKSDSFPSELKNIDPLYKETLETGVKRYMAGIYTDKKNAISACENIKNAGHDDAFVAVYHQGVRINFNQAEDLLNSGKAKLYSQDEKSVIIAGNGMTKEIKPQAGKNIDLENDIRKVQGLFYSIQVGVFKKYFPPERIKNFTPLYVDIAENGLYKHLSGIFYNLNEAGNKQNEIIKNGVSDAFITAYNNGKRIKVADAKKIASEKIQPVEKQEPINVKPQAENKPENIQQKNVAETIYFRVQLGMFTAKIPDEIETIYKKVLGTNYISITDAKGLFVYTKDIFNNYDSAMEQQKELSNAGIENIVIAAFKGSNRISVDKAFELLKK